MTVTAFSATPVTANAAILESYDSGIFQGHTYALFANEMYWIDAKAYCEGLGGHLDREKWPFICEWDSEIVSVKEQTLYRKQLLNVETDFSSAPECTTTASSVVSASDSKITGVKPGTAVVVATDDGKSELLKITIKNPVLNKTSVKLKVNKKFKLTVTGKVGTAKFKSNNAKVASVNAKGMITAKKKRTDNHSG